MNFLDGDANAMIRKRNRRKVRKEMGSACAALLLTPKSHAEESRLRIAGQDVEIQIAAVSANTVRLSFLPIQNDQIVSVATNGSHVQTSWGMRS